MKLPFPENVLLQHLVMLGKTGAGKSSALRVVAEWLLWKKRRVCIVDPKGDWYGLKVGADGTSPGFPVILFGDFKNEKATDVPINERSGAHVAELIATGNRPAVIGMRGWRQAAMTRFWIDFASTLFAKNAGELFLFGDEFHNFAPKGRVLSPEAGESLHWSNRLLSEGRGLGLVCCIASQRPQKVHNDTLTSCETLVAMRVIHAADRGAVKDWIDGNGDDKLGREVLDSLAQLKRGEAWVWSPEVGFGPVRLAFPMFTTFDSFAPPQVQKKVSTSGWADVDLTAVQEKLAAVIEEARANDPAELKRRILDQARVIRQFEQAKPVKVLVGGDPGELRRLRKGLEAAVAKLKELAKAGLGVGVTVDPADVRAVVEDAVGRVVAMVQRAQGRNAAEWKRAQSIAERAVEVLTPLLNGQEALPDAGGVSLVERPPQGRTAIEWKRERPVAPAPPQGDTGIEQLAMTEAGTMRPMPKALLTALAQHAGGLNRQQMLIHADYQPSGDISTFLAAAEREGWILGKNGLLVLTDAGARALGPYDPLPSGQALRDKVTANEKTPLVQRKLLKVLFEAYPDAIARPDLLDRAGYKPSGDISTVLAKLVRIGWVEKDRKQLRAGRTFFDKE